jgi:hypothetical protein
VCGAMSCDQCRNYSHASPLSALPGDLRLNLDYRRTFCRLEIDWPLGAPPRISNGPTAPRITRSTAQMPREHVYGRRDP